MKTYSRKKLFYTLSATLLLTSILMIIIGAWIGSVKTSVSDVIRIIKEVAREGPVSFKPRDNIELIIWEARIPRCIYAIVSGYMLGIAGLLIQAVLRNPLAEPYLLGLSSGAVLGILVLLLLTSAHILVLWPLAGFTGSLVVFIVILAIATATGLSPTGVVLAGVAISSIINSINTVIALRQSAKIFYSISYWLFGSLSYVGWTETLVSLVIMVLVVSSSIMLSKRLNALMLGDDIAENMGYNPRRTRLYALLIAALATAVVTAFSGPIGFIGLVSPHLARMSFGADHRVLVPGTMLIASLILWSADTLARTATAPAELPITIIMAFIGAPYLLGLLIKTRYNTYG